MKRIVTLTVFALIIAAAEAPLSAMIPFPKCFPCNGPAPGKGGSGSWLR